MIFMTVYHKIAQNFESSEVPSDNAWIIEENHGAPFDPKPQNCI